MVVPFNFHPSSTRSMLLIDYIGHGGWSHYCWLYSPDNMHLSAIFWRLVQAIRIVKAVFSTHRTVDITLVTRLECLQAQSFRVYPHLQWSHCSAQRAGLLIQCLSLLRDHLRPLIWMNLFHSCLNARLVSVIFLLIDLFDDINPLTADPVLLRDWGLQLIVRWAQRRLRSDSSLFPLYLELWIVWAIVSCIPRAWGPTHAT